ASSVPSSTLDEHRAAESATDADRGDAAPTSHPLEHVQHVERYSRARRTDRVADRDRTAVDVELGFIDGPERRIESQLGLAVIGACPSPLARDHTRRGGL